MKKSKNNIIDDWLDKYGDPEIEKQVKTQLAIQEIQRLKQKPQTQETKLQIQKLQQQLDET